MSTNKQTPKDTDDPSGSTKAAVAMDSDTTFPMKWGKLGPFHVTINSSTTPSALMQQVEQLTGVRVEHQKITAKRGWKGILNNKTKLKVKHGVTMLSLMGTAINTTNGNGGDCHSNDERLFAASKQGDTNTVWDLLKDSRSQNIDVNKYQKIAHHRPGSQNLGGVTQITSLFVACLHNQLSVVDLLLRANGISANKPRSYDGVSPL